MKVKYKFKIFLSRKQRKRKSDYKGSPKETKREAIRIHQ